MNLGKAPAAVLESFDTLLSDLLEKAGDALPDAWNRLQVPVRPADEDIAAVSRALQEFCRGFLMVSGATPLPTTWRGSPQGRWEKFCTTGVAARCLDEVPAYRNLPVPSALADLMPCC